ncbi:pseudouridine synthase [Acinetobacter sp. c1-l78]|uniref:pseudouridine synthase n=1 Tax=Acinetobacter sp. c1-l78 TaxID=3342803 RepID=UPI0035BB0137
MTQLTFVWDNFIYQPPQHALDIIYQDDHFIVIDKPAGLLSVMGRLPEYQDSAYLRILKDFPQAKVTHRLDMATSGILLFAKHRDAEVAMSKLFQACKVDKKYIAVVEGKIAEQGEIDLPLIADWENRPRQKVDFDIGKPAKTLFQRISYDSEKNISRVALTPITGRSHQLRLHLSSIGHAILGDKLYHPHPEHNHLSQMALHATQLQFIHPFTGQNMDLSSIPPF